MKVEYDLTETQIEGLSDLGIKPFIQKETKWEPKKNGYDLADSLTLSQDMFSRSTSDRIRRLKKDIIMLATIDSWVTENNYKQIYDKGNINWHVYKNNGKWFNGWSYLVPGVTFMTEEGSIELVRLLNIGVVKID